MDILYILFMSFMKDFIIMKRFNYFGEVRMYLCKNHVNIIDYIIDPFLFLFSLAFQLLSLSVFIADFFALSQ